MRFDFEAPSGGGRFGNNPVVPFGSYFSMGVIQVSPLRCSVEEVLHCVPQGIKDSSI